MRHPLAPIRRNRYVTFSGIDGAGKSTQIENLCGRLKDAGFRVEVVAFWDEVAVLGWMRTFSTYALFKGEKGIGSPARPINRRDKNVRSWYMTLLRYFLYLLDALRLRRVLRKRRAQDHVDVVIFDRYLYDELANLSLHNRLSRAYVRFLLTVIPHPDIAYLLDADPVEARTRKPEYPVEFLKENRASYLALSQLAKMIVIAPRSAAEMACEVRQEILKTLSEVQSDRLTRVPCWVEKVGIDSGS